MSSCSHSSRMESRGGFETKAMKHYLGRATSGPFRPNRFLFALSSNLKKKDAISKRRRRNTVLLLLAMHPGKHNFTGTEVELP